MNRDYVRTSPVAPYIDGLLDERHSLGYSYDFEEYIFNVFDHYCIENGLMEPCFSRGFLKKWLDSWGAESPSYHSQRISFVRQLSLYMNSLGVCSYIPVEIVKKETAVPHYLSEDERHAFFLAVDSDKPRVSQPYAWRMWNEYRIIFRILYCCGLRNSEACYLKMEDINLPEGILTIRHSKGDKDRIVYLAEDLADLRGLYRTCITDFLGFLPVWAFPARDPQKHVHKATVDTRFAIVIHSKKHR